MRKFQIALAAVMAIIVVASTAAMAVEIGQRAPGFELPSTKGGAVNLSSFLGKKNVLLEFYVLEFTPT
jgi:peroxiredoxin Q/BCP